MAIDRAQTGYNPAAELVRVTASPNLQDISVRKDGILSSKSYQLAKQLGANFDGFEQLNKMANQNVKQAAVDTANTMTTDELASKIKSGELHSTLSPVYNAVLNNTHYSNISMNTQRDIATKISSGELTFPDTGNKTNADGTPNPDFKSGNQQLEQYLLDRRNKDLEGADQYGVAGYDTHWNQFKGQAIAKNFETLANKQIEFGVATAGEAMNNAISGNLTPEQLSQNVVSAYSRARLPSGALLPAEHGKVVLFSAVNKLADAGNVDGLRAVLDSKLDNGLTIRHALSGKDAGYKIDNFERQAQTIFDSNSHKAQVQSFKDASAQSLQNNGSVIAQGVSNDRAFSIPTELPYIKADGTTGYQKTEPEIYRALNQKTQGMSLPGRLQTFSTNGIVDQESKNAIASTWNNLNSITYNSEGKPSGELSPNFKSGFDTYLAAKAVDPSYANKLAGDDASKNLDDIELLRQTMGMDLNQAALKVSQARNNPTYLNGNTKLSSMSDKIVADLNPSWFGRILGSDSLTGNIDNVRADVKRSAEVMIAAGADQSTVQKSLETYVEKNIVNINGSLVYLRSIPTSSHSSEIVGGSQTQIKRLVDSVGSDVAIQQGFDPEEVRIAVSKDGGNYTFMAKNQPLLVSGRPLVLTKSQVTDWMERDFENYKQDKMLDPERKTLEGQLKAHNLFRQEGQTMMDQLQGRMKLPATDLYLSSPAGFRRLYEAGLSKKPLDEQRVWAKAQLQKGASYSAPATPVKDYSAPEPDLGYGTRPDGTQKGRGFMGELKRPDGNVSTEISVGYEINGKETNLPLIVPTLTKPELDYLLKTDVGSKDFFKNMPKSIEEKAIAHAKKRIAEGKSPFYGQADQQSGGK